MPRLAFALLFSFTIGPLCVLAQEDNTEVRVSVVLNADGSRTVYETNAATQKTVATTTGKDGKLREKIRWDLDENGRFLRGEVLAQRNNFDLSCKTNTTAIITWSRKRIWPKTRA